MRQENSHNMNAYLNWHADEALEFELELYNPLKVSLPLSCIELFNSGSERPLSSVSISKDGATVD